ncbi:hypothetical protein Syun_015721 [Stephania yunnanensis]|uniref:Uncharacterized protein n=1 Tax=Stephania yunnanensis TaxID=152371 RepID=A0AAP0PD32_9MAGN
MVHLMGWCECSRTGASEALWGCQLGPWIHKAFHQSNNKVEGRAISDSDEANLPDYGAGEGDDGRGFHSSDLISSRTMHGRED